MPDMQLDGPSDDGEQVHLVLEDHKHLTAILQAIKANGKQTCTIGMLPGGLELRWEDESKTLQTRVFLKSQAFAAYDVTDQQSFGVHFGQLVETLTVFASSSDERLEIRYPGPNGELQLEMRDQAHNPPLCTYARIYTLDQAPPADMSEYWQDPSSHFLAQGHLLKEAVEDLEWPQGDLQLTLQRDPGAITLQAANTGSLAVELPMHALSAFHCAGERVCWSYKYKNMKAALAHIPTSKDVSTKVAIDSNGMLKVTHMVPMAPAGPGASSMSGMPGTLSLPVATAATQGGAAGAGLAVVTFLTVPLEE